MQAGIIDSTGVLELIMFLEEQFGIKVADEEMTPENLDSVDRIVAFVGRKR
jgi:acyl carrier protein